MNIEKLKENMESRGFSFRYFETRAEAADYLVEALAGTTVGISGSMTVDAMGLYERLQACSDVVWHWKQDQTAACARAAEAEAYISGANGIAETGEIVNIDGVGNRVASTFYGHERLFIVAGVNKLAPDLEGAIRRARNVAAPMNARRLGSKTPCATGELKCYDCRSPGRICRGMSILFEPMLSMRLCELVLIGETLGY